MKTYALLLRGINVGGKNLIPMVKLKKCLEGLGFSNVSTYIASGNVILGSKKSAEAIRTDIEKALPKNFKLDTRLVRVLVLNQNQLQAVVHKKPKGFGEQPKKYHSDVIFLIDIKMTQAMSVFNPKKGVDKIWRGNGAIYSQRLSALRTKSNLSKIIGTPSYQSMTIRNWNTTQKLLALMKNNRRPGGDAL